MIDTETKKKKNKGLKAVIIIIILLLVFLLSGFLVANHYLGKINRVTDNSVIPAENEFFDTDIDDGSLEKLDPDSIVWDGDRYKGSDEHLINILLVGQDRRPGEGRQRSDTMILCSFNPETNELSMISFLRDLYVQIPGYSDNRMNAAYVFGGFPLLKATLYQNFGVTVDGCFEVDFSGFKKIIDIVGGVDIYLTAAEAKIVGDGAKEGMCHLDGDHALIYSRIRKIDSDFQRTSRQRKVLTAIFNNVKSCSVPELLDLVDEGRIAFRPAVELSYLKKEEQEDLLEEISYADATPSLAQAIKMKRFSQEGKLSNEVIESIMSEEKPNQKEKIRIKYEDARRFIPDSVPYNKTGEYIMKALEYYHRVQERQKDRGEAR